jgi:hypothetical protein
MNNKQYPEPGPLDVLAYHFGGDDRAIAIKDYMAEHKVDCDVAKKAFIKAMIAYNIPFKK